MSRDWSVELKKNPIGNAGHIDSFGDGQGIGADTVWTIGGTAAAADGGWTGTLYDNDTGGVPQVATGTFYSTYGSAGRMVGGFGANQQ